MAVYILATNDVVVDGAVEGRFRNEGDAQRFAEWWEHTPGEVVGPDGFVCGSRQRNVSITAGFVECPMIDGVVYVPTSIN